MGESSGVVWVLLEGLLVFVSAISIVIMLYQFLQILAWYWMVK